MSKSSARTLPRIAVAVGAVLLLGTAAFHASGNAWITQALWSASVQAEIVRLVGGLWLFFSWHLGAVAIVALLTAVFRPRSGAAIAVACGVVSFVDAALVFSLSGFFAGVALLLLAAAALIVGGFLWQPRA